MTASPLSYGPFISRSQAKAQGTKWYFTGSTCKQGHVAERQTTNGCCKRCIYSDPNRSIRRKQWAERNPEADKQAKAKWRVNNPEKVNAIALRYSRTDKGRQTQKLWDDANQDRIKAKQAQSRVKRSADPVLCLAHRLRERVRTALKHCKGLKTQKTEGLVGCTWKQLRKHLEGQFTPGMSWENMGQWHIDHVRPCASFDLTDPAQQRECFHYSNLQPLWAADNIAKSDRWEPAAA